MSTPFFLDNTLPYPYLDHMDSTWKEGATTNNVLTENKHEDQVLVSLGEKYWQRVMDAIPKAHIWSQLGQIKQNKNLEKRGS